MWVMVRRHMKAVVAKRETIGYYEINVLFHKIHQIDLVRELFLP